MSTENGKSKTSVVVCYSCEFPNTQHVLPSYYLSMFSQTHMPLGSKVYLLTLTLGMYFDKKVKSEQKGRGVVKGLPEPPFASWLSHTHTHSLCTVDCWSN